MSHITLQTACGCSRSMNVGEGGWPHLEIVIILACPTPTVVRVEDGEIVDYGRALRTRRFRVSKWDRTVYEEVLP